MKLTRPHHILTISFALIAMYFFSGCGYIGAFLIAKNATCKVKINDKCVNGSCDLTNGVLFERLTVINKDNSGIPSEYVVTERFACDNLGNEGLRKIYFKRPNRRYKWKADTVEVHYKQTGRKREIISMRKNSANFNEVQITNSIKYDLCPISFQKNTWYNVSVYDTRLSKILLFVDDKNIFNVYNFGSGICPI